MAKYKALLIDDNTQFTEMVKGYLLSQDRFSEVDTAQDGREALKKLREKTYDVMTLDLIMPNADGLAVLEQLSLLPLDPAPAVVVISALKNEAMVRRCCALGARYYMVKPVEADTIMKRLLETLEGEPVKGGVMPYAPTHRSFEEKVTAIFLVAGIPAHIKGYHYLREGIRLVYNDPDLINRITKELYPGIAKRFDTSPSKVERVPRHRQAVRHLPQQGGAGHPPRHRGGLDPGQDRKPERPLRLQHLWQERQAHQWRIHRPGGGQALDGGAGEESRLI